MKYFAVTLIIFLIPFFAFTQKSASSFAQPIAPKTNTYFLELGEDYVRIRVFQYGDSKDLFFINLHDDEATAVSGATRLLEKEGGTLVKIENDRNRNIRFKLDGRYYAFDPNRIFSRTGIIQTLRTFGPISNKAINELDRFAHRILEFLPPPPTVVIALHNNYNGKFSITSYMQGMERAKDARAIRYFPKEDPDDLFLTTDSLLFQDLSKEKFNIVWQDNIKAYKDGSLSVYCGERKIRYLNCETEHGRLTQYSDMIGTAVRHVRKGMPLQIEGMETATYNYKFSSNTQVSPGNYEIYFGDRKIGMINGAIASANKPGQVEILKTFIVNDNMDLFLYPSAKDTKKIELRVDPTRTGKAVDPGKGILVIKVMQ